MYITKSKLIDKLLTINNIIIIRYGIKLID